MLTFSDPRSRQASQALRALGQLSDVAHILSTEDSLAKYLQREVWNARYGLSDSIFLLARDAADACLAGAEFFFNIGYYNATERLPVLMRGSITFEMCEKHARFSRRPEKAT